MVFDYLFGNASLARKVYACAAALALSVVGCNDKLVVSNDAGPVVYDTGEESGLDAGLDAYLDSDGVEDADVDRCDYGGENLPPSPIESRSYDGFDGCCYEMGVVIPVSFKVPSDPDCDVLTAELVIESHDYPVDFRISYDLGGVVSGERIRHQVSTGTDNDGGPFPAAEPSTMYSLTIIVRDPEGIETTLSREFGLLPEGAGE